MNTTPLSITNEIALRLNAPLDVCGTARIDAVEVIVRNFMNYARKHERSQQGFFSQIIIEILQRGPEIDVRDLMDVCDILAAGDARAAAEADADLKSRIEARRQLVAA
jgi:hypothetical protein